VLDHGHYIMGPEVFELEEKLAEYTGVRHVITCANGTDALHLSLLALGIGPGDAIITSPFTFFATAEVISLVGAVPVFSDIDAKTFNLCPDKLVSTIREVEARAELKLKAVITVDLFGLPSDYERIESVCEEYGLELIEDAAQGFGGEINGKRAGSFGSIATTSFFPAKPLGCYGDGGALFTDCDHLAETLRSLRVHGKGDNKYDNVRIGLNSRLDTLQAAVLLEKLRVFPDEVDRRNQVADTYLAYLEETALELPVVPPGYRSSWAQFTVLAGNKSIRDSCMNALKAQGIPSAIYYPKPLHRQQAFLSLESNEVSPLVISEEYSNRVFSLPMHPYLDLGELKVVCDVLAEGLASEQC